MRLKLRDFEGTLAPGSAGELVCKVKDAIGSPKAEILATFAEIGFDAKSTAAGIVTLTAADVETILDALCDQVDVTQNGQASSVSIDPKTLRRVAARMMGKDALTEQLSAGYVYNGSAGAVKRAVLPVALAKFDVNLQPNPNVLSQSGRQVNQEEWYLSMRDPAGWAAVALSSGNIIISNVSAKLWAIRSAAERKEEFVGPVLEIKERSWTANPESEEGPFFDVMVALKETPATADAALDELTVTMNGGIIAEDTTPGELARSIMEQAQPQDGLHPLDITAGTNGICPIFAPSGIIDCEEPEWPVCKEGKARILKSSASGAVDEILVVVRVGDIYASKTQDFIRKLLADLKRSGLKFEQLAIKGGGPPFNGVHGRFKGRYLAPAEQAGK